jgi:predicted  nucleic acid-binding Zn-ribbon protein
MGEVLELLKKNEEGGGSTREMGLQALVSQQSTMTNTITSLLQQARLLKEELRQAEDSDEVQDLEDEITGVIQSRREMRQQLLDLDMEIRKETVVVARERKVVVEREHQEQMSRRARDTTGFGIHWWADFLRHASVYHDIV